MAAPGRTARTHRRRTLVAVLAVVVVAAVVPPAGARAVRCLGKPATIIGTAASETIKGTRGNDVIHARGGADEIDGRGGHDIICGGAGNDVIRGGNGNDRIQGGEGSDTLYGGAGSDDLFGGPGADTIKGYAGKDTLEGGPGDDGLYGGDANDTMIGESGLDRCHGGAGRDEAASCEVISDTELGQLPQPSIRPTDNGVALTFDDGPHPVYTPMVLNVLKWYGVKATFFVIGSQVGRYPHLIRRMVSEGHVVLNHSWSHPNLTSVGDGKVRYELRRTQEALADGAGIQPRCFRAPYGATNSRVNGIASEFGLTHIGWDVSAGDWLRPSSSFITERILTADGGDIVLLHDGGGVRTNTVMALVGIIDGFRDRGIAFETLCG